jgi:hypothetical protein
MTVIDYDVCECGHHRELHRNVSCVLCTCETWRPGIIVDELCRRCQTLHPGKLCPDVHNQTGHDKMVMSNDELKGKLYELGTVDIRSVLRILNNTVAKTVEGAQLAAMKHEAAFRVILDEYLNKPARCGPEAVENAYLKVIEAPNAPPSASPSCHRRLGKSHGPPGSRLPASRVSPKRVRKCWPNCWRLHRWTSPRSTRSSPRTPTSRTSMSSAMPSSTSTRASAPASPTFTSNMTASKQTSTSSPAVSRRTARRSLRPGRRCWTSSRSPTPSR